MGVWAFSCVEKQRGGVRWEWKNRWHFASHFQLLKKKTNQKTNTHEKTKCWLIRNLKVINGINDEMAQERKTQNRPKAKLWHISTSFLFINSSKCITVLCFLGSSLKAKSFKKQKQILKNYKSLLFMKKSLTIVTYFELLSEKLKSIN